MKIRCIIIEDEVPTQEELKFLLSQYDFITVAGCAADGVSGYGLIRELQPDVVFLDISIPGMNGIELAAKLRYMSRPPRVVFTTAYSEHAVKAFELGAADYLLKPYDEERVHLALERILRSMAAEGPAQERTARTAPQALERLPVLENGKTVLIDSRTISYCVSENEVITVVADGGRYLSLHTLQELIERAGLFRIHKSFGVNPGRIREIYPWFNGTYQIVLDNPERSQLTVSRSYVKLLKGKLGL